MKLIPLTLIATGSVLTNTLDVSALPNIPLRNGIIVQTITTEGDPLRLRSAPKCNAGTISNIKQGSNLTIVSHVQTNVSCPTGNISFVMVKTNTGQTGYVSRQWIDTKPVLNQNIGGAILTVAKSFAVKKNNVVITTIFPGKALRFIQENDGVVSVEFKQDGKTIRTSIMAERLIKLFN